jgi:hypothetical protein
LASNPVRVKVTRVPEGPEVGFTVSWGVTVKEAEADPLFPSTPVKIWAPVGAAGIVYVQVNAPVPEVVAVHAVPWFQLTVIGELGA